MNQMPATHPKSLPGRKRGGRNSHSIVSKIEAYFTANPDECLSIEDAVVKFHTVYQVAARHLWALNSVGFLCRHKEGRTAIYSKAGAQ